MTSVFLVKPLCWLAALLFFFWIAEATTFSFAESQQQHMKQQQQREQHHHQQQLRGLSAAGSMPVSVAFPVGGGPPPSPLRTDHKPDSRECVVIPDSCPCPQTVRACHYEVYLCDLAVKELENSADSVAEENFLSRFDHPLLTTLQTGTLGGASPGGEGASDQESEASVCDTAGQEAMKDCLAYFTVCNRNRVRMTKWSLSKKSETNAIYSNALAL